MIGGSVGNVKHYTKIGVQCDCNDAVIIEEYPVDNLSHQLLSGFLWFVYYRALIRGASRRR